jgi:hypothetical protein
MTFQKKAPKPPKASLDDLLRTGAVVVGAELMEAQEAKDKELKAFSEAVKNEVSDRRLGAHPHDRKN